MKRLCILGFAFLLFAGAAIGLDGLPKKILFIGNSLTYYNRGLGHLLEKLAVSASPPMSIKCDDATMSSMGLRLLWLQRSDRHDRILKGCYDIVVLQDTLVAMSGKYSFDTEEQFNEYTKKFDDEIRKGGAHTVLLMHWRLKAEATMPIEDVERLHTDVSKKLNVEVAPAGLAWLQSERERPELNLYADELHPEAKGSYLTACVLYATIFKKNPTGLSYIADDIDTLDGKKVTQDEATFLQQVAWQTVMKYKPANVSQQP